MGRFFVLLVALFAVAFAAIGSTALGQDTAADDGKSADLVLVDGKVVTVERDVPLAQAVAIRGSRILAVGGNDAIRKLAGDKTRVIDLAGRLAVPGFIEGHGHFIALGRTKLELDLSTCKTWDEVVARVAKAAADAKRYPAGRWIVGRGWHQDKWTEKPSPNVEGYPVHAALSRATPNHPVLLVHATGHMAMVNAKVLHLAGIADFPRDPKGGRILRDKDGRPTGALREMAVTLVDEAYARERAKRPREELDAERREAIRLANAECLRLGVTSFQDAGSNLEEIEALRACVGTDDLAVRMWMMTNDSDAAIAKNLLRYRIHRFGDAQFTVGGIKRMIDGALGTHGAWLLQPYDDLPQSVGHNVTPLASLRASAELALRLDWQLCVHAIGDRANHEVLGVMADAMKSNADRIRQRGQELRWRIEHAQHLHPDDIPRFAELGVIASMQGCHATSDGPFVITRLGQRRAKSGAYVWQSLLKSGARVINGTDAPVESLDPVACFYASVTRRMAGGAEFFPEQCMTREEALRSYTLDAAYAAFEEDLKGSIVEGKLADIVVLSEDIMTAAAEKIRVARVDYTILGGKVVYERKTDERDER
ncbi:MAG: amidohydrolase [Planctomycetota bacterium]|nr:MAG: amidohydrolase [Planctomycetota bacterium]